jgi:hypothetical protein
MYDLSQINFETQWLLDHPDFWQRPATMEEFLGPEYLDIASKIRPGIYKALCDIFEQDPNRLRISQYERAMVTGGIGIGKTTFASIALPYMAHWVLCLKDPQAFFNLLPGSRIAFMQMSTSEQQAREVIFGDIQARIKNSKWFSDNFPMDPKFTRQIRFDKDIWILPGDSAETTFEGYNILGGILDEADSHKITADKDYAEQGYDTIDSRIASRFVDNSDPNHEGHLGLLIVIGQMKKAVGFAARKYREFQEDKRAYTVRMSIWESFGWDKYTKPDGTRNSFFYSTKRRMIIPPEVGKMLNTDHVIEIPQAFAKQFQTNPEKALRDLAGIPPATSDPFISLVDRIEEAQEKWVERVGEDSPVDTSCSNPQFASWFSCNGDPRRRAIHVDLAYSDKGDALGMAMGYVESLAEVEGENKPYIVFDFLLRVRANPGTEIMLSDIRRIIYHLRDDRKFRIKKVTYDGFESTDTIQQLRKKRFEADKVSVDKSTMPYEDLREAIYERRIEFPRYMTHVTVGDSNVINIAYKELTELSIIKGKVDHPPNGSKDVADAMAGVVYTLMGDRQYRRGMHRISAGAGTEKDEEEALREFGLSVGTTSAVPTLGGTGLQAPVPPRAFGDGGLTVPPRLRSRR